MNFVLSVFSDNLLTLNQILNMCSSLFNMLIVLLISEPLTNKLVSSANKIKCSSNNLPEQTEKQERNWMMASAVLFTAALVLLWTAIISERSINIVQLNPVTSGICELFSNENMINTEMANSYKNSFDAVRKKLGLKCNNDRRFIFYYSDKYT